MATPRPLSTLVPLGAVNTVTGSKFLVEHAGSRVLFDAGLFQGLRELRERNWAAFPVPPDSLDAVVISHAHLDHCGYLPRLVKAGFRGPVYVTYDTGRLMSVVLPDSARLLEEEARYANRAGYSRHHPALALYTEDDAWSALEQLHPQPFGASFEAAKGITVTFRPAGHILGSATVRVVLEGGPTVQFSGDLGRPNHPLLVPPEPVGSTDYLVVESTYGDREHTNGHAPEALADVITRTVDRGGKVIIPAFAVDRTEVLLHHLRRLHDSGALPAVPIFVDSPMALAALRIYRDAFEQSAADVRPELHDAGELFDLPNLSEVHDSDGSKAVTAHHGSAIIIAGAGGAAHLPGMIASQTVLPVLGVPVQSKALNGLDSLLSIVQMPGGVPVATLAIGTAGAKNAGLLAVRILALQNPQLNAAMHKFCDDQTNAVLNDCELS